MNNPKTCQCPNGITDRARRRNRYIQAGVSVKITKPKYGFPVNDRINRLLIDMPNGGLRQKLMLTAFREDVDLVCSRIYNSGGGPNETSIDMDTDAKLIEGSKHITAKGVNRQAQGAIEPEQAKINGGGE